MAQGSPQDILSLVQNVSYSYILLFISEPLLRMGSLTPSGTWGCYTYVRITFGYVPHVYLIIRSARRTWRERKFLLPPRWCSLVLGSGHENPVLSPPLFRGCKHEESLGSASPRHRLLSRADSGSARAEGSGSRGEPSCPYLGASITVENIRTRNNHLLSLSADPHLPFPEQILALEPQVAMAHA